LNERIKDIRIALQITQEDFGKRIGSARNTIANYETGNRNPSNAVIMAICREFNVNENWLRTGEGEMFLNFPVEDEYFKAATEISKSNDKLAMQAVIEYWKLDEDSKKLLRNFIIHIAEKSKE
jgi:transcriptional regulator with XRE-family HTH domain